MTSLEDLSADMLDEKFINIYKPLIYVQTAVGSARVNVSYKFVSPPLWFQRFYCCVYVLYCTYGYYYLCRKSAFYEFYREQTSIEYFLTFAQVFSEYCLYAVIMIVNNFFYRYENSHLFLTLQNIDRTMKFIEKVDYGKRLHSFNLYTCMCIITVHVLFSASVVLRNVTLNELPLAVPVLISLTVEDFESVLYLSVLFHLCDRVKYINGVIEKNTWTNWQQRTPEPTDVCDVFQRACSSYRNVATAFRIIEKTFSHFMLFIVIHTFSNQLLSIERFILLGKNVDWHVVFQQNSLVFKLYFRICLIGFVVNYFQMQVEHTKCCCIRVLEQNRNVTVRRCVKNILRVISVQMYPFTVFRMFTVHNLPTRMLALAATYSIVLLQFAFL